MKPAPLTAAAVIVTGAVPVEFTVTVSVTAWFTETLPKARLVEPRFNVGTAALSSKAKLSLVPPAFAVSFTACVLETAETLAVNAAVVAPELTVTEAGVVTAALLLDRLTLKPPVCAAELSVTVQEFAPAPVKADVLQVSALSSTVGCAAPMPVRTTRVGLLESSMVILSWPVAGPAAAGLKTTFKPNVPPGATEIGRVFCPAIENDVPVMLSAVMFTGVELPLRRETEALALFPTRTLPRLTEVVEATSPCTGDRVTTSAMQPVSAKQRTETIASADAFG